MNRPELSADEVRSKLRYDAETGALVWRGSAGRGSRTDRVGMQAGSPHKDGYVAVQVGTKKYLAHRLIWLIVTGAWPKDEIDHKNRVRNDNRWANLRCVTRSVNQQNRGPDVGVDLVRRTGKWRARITAGGRCISLGYFSDEASARQRYAVAKERLHA